MSRSKDDKFINLYQRLWENSLGKEKVTGSDVGGQTFQDLQGDKIPKSAQELWGLGEI